jgi:hypothetical protein
MTTLDRMSLLRCYIGRWISIDHQLAAPSVHAPGNLLVGAAIMVDGALEQQLGLGLGRHAVERFGLMLRKDVADAG